MKQFGGRCHVKATLQTALAVAAFGGAICAHAAPTSSNLTPCLDYFTVGISGCTPVQPSPTVAAQPVTPTVVAASPVAVTQTLINPPTLDTKIDDFLADHGKPPREFAAFYLEPTADNAMKWISKYNELIDRNIQLTIAWEQAEVLYKQQLANGVSPSSLVSSTLPPVPNFGVAIPGLTDNTNLTDTTHPGFGNSLYIASPPAIPGIDPQTGALGSMPLASITPLADGGRIGGLPIPVPSAAVPASPAVQPATALESDLTYYYSAVCPYCKRFNPELQQLFAANPNLSLTCVDLTPHEIGPHTAPAGLPCKWRMAGDNELAEQGVRQTPTLILKGSGSYPLKVSGYVDQERLNSYLSAAGLLKAPKP